MEFSVALDSNHGRIRTFLADKLEFHLPPGREKGRVDT